MAEEVVWGSGDSWRKVLRPAGVCILTFKCFVLPELFDNQTEASTEAEGRWRPVWTPSWASLLFAEAGLETWEEG